MRDTASLKKIIKKYIRPLKRRLFFERILRILGIGLLVIGIVLLVLIVISRFYPIPELNTYILWTGLAGILVSCLIPLFQIPRFLYVLRIADQLGSAERLITSLEFAESMNETEVKQRQDTLDYMQNEKLDAKKYPIYFSKRIYIVSVILFLGSFLVFNLNTASSDLAHDQKEFRKEAVFEAIKLEKELEDIIEKSDLTDQQKEELEAILEELKQELQSTKSEEEAMKKLSIAKNEIEEITMEELARDMQEMKDVMEEMAEKLERNEELQSDNQLNEEEKKELEEALQEELQSLMEELQEAFEGVDDESLEALMEQLDDMSAEELQEALDALEQALAEGNIEDMESALGELQELMADAQSMMESMDGDVSDLLMAINSAASDLSSSPSLSELAFQRVTTPTSTTSGQTPSSTTMNTPGNGSSSTGSTNEDAGYTEEDNDGVIQGNDGANPEEDNRGMYESLYPPENIGGESDPSFVSGDQQDKGESTYTQVQSLPTDGGQAINYSEIYAQYEEAAMSTVDQLEVPYLMREVVKEYFESLNDQ